jgi:hypothetical protein
MTTGIIDFITAAGFITPRLATPTPLLAVPYAAPTSEPAQHGRGQLLSKRRHHPCSAREAATTDGSTKATRRRCRAAIRRRGRNWQACGGGGAHRKGGETRRRLVCWQETVAANVLANTIAAAAPIMPKKYGAEDTSGLSPPWSTNESIAARGGANGQRHTGLVRSDEEDKGWQNPAPAGTGAIGAVLAKIFEWLEGPFCSTTCSAMDAS